MTDLETLIKHFQDKNQVAFEKLYGICNKSIHGVVSTL
jgi:hypothetical protein